MGTGADYMNYAPVLFKKDRMIKGNEKDTKLKTGKLIQTQKSVHNKKDAVSQRLMTELLSLRMSLMKDYDNSK